MRHAIFGLYGAALLLGLAGDAFAKPIVSACYGDSAKGEGLVINPGESYGIDADGDGGSDVGLAVITTGSGWRVQMSDPTYPSVVFPVTVDDNGWGVTLRYDEGDVIQLSDASWSFAARVTYNGSGGQGGAFLDDPTPGYIAFYFNRGAAGHFGWAEITVVTGEHIILHRYGYEKTAHDPIAAGAGSIGPADFDASGEVGANDLFELLSAWGPCAGCEEDLTGNEAVESEDLFELLAAWGSC